MTSLLSVANLSVRFKTQKTLATAVDDFSLTINPGECVGLVGESGCGKTTTGLAIMRLLPANGKIASGSVLLNGVDLASLSESDMQKQRGRTVALIPQDPMSSLNPVMKIGKQIGEGLRIHEGASEEEANRRALEVLEMVEMPNPKERLNQYPFELSGGLRQRVIIAMGLVCRPNLLIADEPTTALDVTIQAQILDIIDSLRRDLNMGVLLITHDMGVIAGRADRVVVMYGGRKAEEAPTEELFGRMRHPYTQALLASVPSIEATSTSQLSSIAGMPPDLTKDIVGCRFAPRCSFATDECRQTEPDLGGDAPHQFACFHPVDGPSPVTITTAVRHNTEASASGKELVRVEGLTKEFPIKSGLLRRTTAKVHAVSNVSFSVREGTTLGLVGESGCGKTTLGRMIVGLETVTGGEISFDGHVVSAAGYRQTRDDRRQRQMMFQDPYSSLNPRMKVSEILAEPLVVQREGDRQSRLARVAQLLDIVGLDVRAGDRYPHEFSGGQRQRIGLARALALNPRLIVADEPVSALDVSIQAGVVNLLDDLQQELGVSYLFVAHDLSVVRHVSNRVAVMYLGRIVEIGDQADIYEKPQHPYTQALLSAVPIPDPRRERQRQRIILEGDVPSPENPPSGCRFRSRCWKAQDICAQEVPELVDRGAGHAVACHFPEELQVL